MTVTLRPIEYDVLADFAEGRTPVQIAQSSGHELDLVNGILTRKCGMNRAKACELVDEGGGSIDTDGRQRAALSPLTAPIATPFKAPAAPPAKAAAAPVQHRAPAAVTPTRTAPPPKTVTVAPAQPAPQATVTVTTTATPAAPKPGSSVDELLAQSEAHDQPRVRAMAERVRALLARLVDVIDEEQRLAAARKHVAELEAELAKARAQLPAAPAKPRTRADLTAIRQWAADNDIDCPRLGRIPGRVLDAYKKANPGEAT